MFYMGLFKALIGKKKQLAQIRPDTCSFSHDSVITSKKYDNRANVCLLRVDFHITAFCVSDRSGEHTVAPSKEKKETQSRHKRSGQY